LIGAQAGRIPTYESYCHGRKAASKGNWLTKQQFHQAIDGFEYWFNAPVLPTHRLYSLGEGAPCSF